MKTYLFLPTLLSLSILGASCTKEVKYSKEALYAKAKAAEPSVTFTLPKSINEGARCEDYSEGCLAAHVVQVKKLEFIAVEYGSEQDAKLGAKKFRGYYMHNWMFDDVTGEPDLEKFVVEKLQAKKP